MAGFLGAGNYGVARMNGGFSARPCVGLAPADGGLGAHFVHDVRHMLSRRGALLEEYSQYFKERDGIALLWIEPWGGMDSLSLDELDPYFIEICRRVRLVQKGEALAAKRASSKRSRIDGKSAKGDLGDHWTPVERTEVKALSVSAAGFRYDQLFKLLSAAASFACRRQWTWEGRRRASGGWWLAAWQGVRVRPRDTTSAMTSEFRRKPRVRFSAVRVERTSPNWPGPRWARLTKWQGRYDSEWPLLRAEARPAET